MLALCLLLTGCLTTPASPAASGPAAGPSAEVMRGADADASAAQAPTPGPGNIPTDVARHDDKPTVRVMMITLPAGTASGNEKVWRLVNEDALSADTSVLLAQNGLRAAVAPLSRWPALAGLIDTPSATTRWLYAQTDGRTPLLIRTHENVRSQTLFVVDKDTHLEGRSYADCDNGMRLAMTRERGTDNIMVQLEPVVQLGTVSYHRLVPGLTPAGVTQPKEETLVGLRIQALLKPGHFLLVAPSDTKEPYLVGTRFLANTDTVPATETLLVFIPGAASSIEPGH
jgi:hypothetical protein